MLKEKTEKGPLNLINKITIYFKQNNYMLTICNHVILYICVSVW